MKQLDLTALQLRAKGFHQYVNEGRVTYRINTINGHLKFNPIEEVCVWYHATILGEVSNHVLLNIEIESELDSIIKMMRCNEEINQ